MISYKKILYSALLCFIFLSTVNLFSQNGEIRKLPPEGLVDLESAIPGIILDIRYASVNNFTGTMLDGYVNPRAFLRPASAEALKRVNERLKEKGYILKVYDAYRPLRTTQAMIDWAVRTGNQKMLGTYISRKAYPDRITGHECGNTVDVTLCTPDGKEVDMGTPFDEFSYRAHLFNAEGEILKNRMILKEAMEAEGFSYYEPEWWHFINKNDPGPARNDLVE